METTSTNWDLAHLLVVLRRRRAWIVGSALVAMALALAYSLIAPPSYQARAEVLVEPESVQSDPDMLGRVFFMDQELQTQLQLMRSEALAARVADTLSMGSEDAVLSKVSTAVVPETRVIQVTATDGDPEQAAQLAQTVAEQYLEFRREDALDRLVQATSTIRQQLEAGREEVDRLDAEIEQATDSTRRNVLGQDRQNTADEVAELRTQLSRLESAEPVTRGGGQIIQDAEVPGSPASPKPAQNTLVAMVLGLGVGLVLAIAVETVDRTVRTIDEAGAVTGRPVLGRIPLASEEQGGDLPMLRHPTGPVAESFRDLRTNLRFVGDVEPPRSVVVTSAIQGEGKSVTAANLALASVVTGQRVVLIDADLRRPAIGRMFGLDDQAGLSTVLSGEHDLDEVLLELEEPNLTLLLAGRRPPNPNELVGSQRMVQVLDRLGEHFDLVVVDVPPVMVVPDVLELAHTVDSTLLVVELQRSARHEITDSCERLERVGAQLAGLVVNRADLDPGRYSYYYAYGDEAAG